MRTAPSQLGPLQREISPACPEDPPGFPGCHPCPAPLSCARCPVLSVLCLVLLWWVHVFYFLVHFLVKTQVTCLKEALSWGIQSLRFPFFSVPLPSLYRRADIKPKTAEGRVGAGRLEACLPYLKKVPPSVHLSIFLEGLQTKLRLQACAW